jgi:hypothetical protein
MTGRRFWSLDAGQLRRATYPAGLSGEFGTMAGETFASL